MEVYNRKYCGEKAFIIGFSPLGLCFLLSNNRSLIENPGIPYMVQAFGSVTVKALETDDESSKSKRNMTPTPSMIHYQSQMANHFQGTIL